jgi:hypothetical protein
MNHLKQTSLALHLYGQNHRCLPYGASFGDTLGGTWAAFILPHIEQNNVYELFDFNRRIWDTVNVPAVQAVIPILLVIEPGSGARVVEFDVPREPSGSSR